MWPIHWFTWNSTILCNGMFYKRNSTKVIPFIVVIKYIKVQVTLILYWGYFVVISLVGASQLCSNVGEQLKAIAMDSNDCRKFESIIKVQMCITSTYRFVTIYRIKAHRIKERIRIYPSLSTIALKQRPFVGGMQMQHNSLKTMQVSMQKFDIYPHHVNYGRLRQPIITMTDVPN